MKRTLSKKYLLIFLYSGLAGIIIGTIVFFVRFGLKHLSSLSRDIYSYINGHLYFLPLLFLIVIILGFLVAFLVKKMPFIQGGGIARTEGLLRGLIPSNPIELGLGTLISTVVSYFIGLPIGTEGLIIGSSIGDGVSRLDKTNASKRYVMSAGAAAGFAVSTGAPLTCITFVLERMHKKFSFLLVLVLISGVGFAYPIYLLLGNLFNFTGPFLDFKMSYEFVVSDIWIFVIIGIVMGLFTILFTTLIKLFNKFSLKLFKNNVTLKIIVNFLLVSLAGVFVLETIGGGTNLINNLFNNHFEITLLLLVFLLKFFLILVSAQSGATGGMFGAVLVLGVLMGKLISFVLISLGVDSSYETIIMLTAMTTFFGTVMNSPLSAIIFALESTWLFTQSYIFIIPLLFALAICHLAKGESINDILLSTMLRRQNKDKKAIMIRLQGEVMENSFVINNQARDILLPSNCLITSMKRKDNELSDYTMVKSGDKHFHSGDSLIFSIQTYDLDETKKDLMALIGKQELKVIEN
ncbi:chloride channel protein [Acholeplasma sp. OttesenSCG-928-E16]|nr:chloride channel protein [Acholeplasma sp. OttesenSCG-928-E16]